MAAGDHGRRELRIAPARDHRFRRPDAHAFLGLARSQGLSLGERGDFKGGWGSGTGWVDHQVALLTRGDERVSVAILTYHDGTHAYGLATLRGIAERLLRGLGAAEPVR